MVWHDGSAVEVAVEVDRNEGLMQHAVRDAAQLGGFHHLRFSTGTDHAYAVYGVHNGSVAETVLGSADDKVGAYRQALARCSAEQDTRHSADVQAIIAEQAAQDESASYLAELLDESVEITCSKHGSIGLHCVICAEEIGGSTGSDSAAYLAELVADDSASAASDHEEMLARGNIDNAALLDNGMDSATSDKAMLDCVEATEHVLLYTTNPLGDLPATMILDSHIGMYNGKVVRMVSCPKEKETVQRDQYRDGTRFLSVGANGWHALSGSSVAPMAPSVAPMASVVAPSVSYADVASGAEYQDSVIDYSALVPDADVRSIACADATVLDTASTEADKAVQEAETALQLAQDTLFAAQEAAQAADEEDLDVQIKVLQAKKRVKACQEAVSAAQAAQSKARAVVVIDSEMRLRLNTLYAIIGNTALSQAERDQRLARAFNTGLLYVKVASKAKKDTGVVRKVAATPSSNGMVEVHRHGSSATAVTSARGKELSEHEVREVEALLVKGMGNTAIAKRLGLCEGDHVRAAKLVFHARARYEKRMQA